MSAVSAFCPQWVSQMSEVSDLMSAVSKQCFLSSALACPILSDFVRSGMKWMSDLCPQCPIFAPGRSEIVHFFCGQCLILSYICPMLAL